MIDSKNLTYSDAALVLSRELIPGSNLFWYPNFAALVSPTSPSFLVPDDYLD